MINKKRRSFILALLPFFILGIFMVTTNPAQLPLGLLILPVVLLFLGTYKMTRLILKLAGAPLPGGTHRLIALIMATIPALLLIMQSIHELTVRDIALLITTGIVLVAYVVKLRPTF